MILRAHKINSNIIIVYSSITLIVEMYTIAHRVALREFVYKQKKDEKLIGKTKLGLR
jgi:hypothetical protein